MKHFALKFTAVAAMWILIAGYAWAGNTVFGIGAGSGGDWNTFIGENAGYDNDDGVWNTFLGFHSGYSKWVGNYNTFIGAYSGNADLTGYFNTFIGAQTGQNATGGHRNILIGYGAGFDGNSSNKLYIDNCYLTTRVGICDTPLIYGEFDSRMLMVDGTLVMGSPAMISDGRI